MTQARQHIASARSLAAADPTLALAACHDAIRKAIDAHCGANGYRIENRPGAHLRAIEYAREVLAIPDDITHELDRVRTRRHAAEYGEVPSRMFKVPEIEHAAELADLVVTRVVERLTAGR